MQTIGTILTTTLPNTDQWQTSRNSDKWRSIEPTIRQDLKEAGIDIIPRNLAEILAKIHTGESIGGKGLFLLGNTGTGKSLRLKWAAEAFGITMITATDLCDSLMETETTAEKENILLTVPPRWNVVPRHYNDLIIDDLGTEPDGQNIYGTKRNLIADAILRRYDVFPHWKTHFTSNMTGEAIRARYGERVWSRLNEMVVFVTLAGEDRRLA